MARDRININNNYYDELIKYMNEKNILDFGMLDNKDIFLLAASLGLNNPTEIQGGKFGFVRLEYIKTYEMSLMASILLGKATNNDEIDKYSDVELSYSEAERCAETGFGILKQKIEDAKNDEELLYKRLMSEIDLLYETKVIGN